MEKLDRKTKLLEYIKAEKKQSFKLFPMHRAKHPLYRKSIGYALNPFDESQENELSAEDLPTLYGMLLDYPQDSSEWKIVMCLIAKLDTPENVFKTVCYYIKPLIKPPNCIVRNNMSNNRSTMFFLVRLLGHIDPKVSGNFLKHCITLQGADEIVGAWSIISPPKDYENDISTFRCYAALGILCTENMEMYESLEEQYQLIKKIPENDDRFFKDYLFKTLVAKDIFLDYGFRKGWIIYEQEFVSNLLSNDHAPSYYRFCSIFLKYLRKRREKENSNTM